MLIVITKDPVIVNFRQQAGAGEAAWGPIHVINAAHDQQHATAQLIGLLRTVGNGEPLAIVGHGSDTECGGSLHGNDTWTWTAQELANLLNTELSAKPGPILLEVCSDDPEDTDKFEVVGFGTEVQKEFGQMQVSNHLKGVTVYSYNTHIKKKHTLPDPAKISKSAELQGSKL